MNPFETAGAFSWAELLTSDPEAAADFYRQVFGWTTESMDMSTGPYTVVKVAGESVGGIMKMPPTVPDGTPPHWASYVTVDNVDATIETIKSAGGNIVMPAFDVPTVGRLAVIQDPQGAHINIIQYAPQTADAQ